MSHKIIKGKTVAEPILEEFSSKVMALKELGWELCLASIEIGDNPAVSLYVRNQ